MKRTSLIVVSLLVGLILLPLAVQADPPKFSKPVLVGGDAPAADVADQTQSKATHMLFFRHPSTAATGGVNFKDDMSPINGTDYPVGLTVKDIVATPGFNGQDTVNASSPMVEQLKSRVTGELDVVNGIGPDDFFMKLPTCNADSTPNYNVLNQRRIGIEYKLSGGNVASHRLVMGDVRMEEGAADETLALFGMQDALEVALIGDASEKAPYNDDLYPAAVIKKYERNATSKQNVTDYTGDFRFCMVNVPLWQLALGYSDTTCPEALRFGPEYSLNHGVMLYDVTDFRTGMVSASYDSFLLEVSGQILTMNLAGTALSAPDGCAADAAVRGIPVVDGPMNIPFYSPLAMFRKVTPAGEMPRYKFTGYTSWDQNLDGKTISAIDAGKFSEAVDLSAKKMMSGDLNINTSGPKEVAGEAGDYQMNTGGIHELAPGGDSYSPVLPVAPDLFFKTFFNPALPMLTNPIAVNSTKNRVVVTYQTTLWDGRKPMYDIAGRPLAVPKTLNGDGGTEHLLYGNAIGYCDATPCTDANFHPLSSADAKKFLLDDVVSPVVTYRVANQWLNPTEAQGDYINQNPSHVLEFEGMGLVGPGMFDAEGVIDDVSGVKVESLLVPSALKEGEVSGMPLGAAIVYRLGAKGKHVFMRTLSKAPGATCGFESKFSTLHALLPEEIIQVARPPIQNADFVPYEIHAFKDDACSDFIVTWRGAHTIRASAADDIQKVNWVAFSSTQTISSSGNPQMFAPGVTRVPRNLVGGACVANNASWIGLTDAGAQTPKAQVASAAVGDVDGDGTLDLIMGDLIPRTLAGDATKISAHVWIQYNFAPPSEKVRVGVNQGDASLPAVQQVLKVPGVARVSLEDKPTAGLPRAIAAINGYPLMLPPVGCPKYKVANTNKVADVGSIYETYLGINYNLGSAFFTTKMPNVYFNLNGTPEYPFTPIGDSITGPTTMDNVDDVSLRPVPPRCVEKQLCEINGIALPFFEEDKCCQILKVGQTSFGAAGAAEAKKTCEDFIKAYPIYGCSYTTSSNAPDGMGSEAFALAWRPDEVVGEDGHAIASISDTAPAAGGTSPMGNLPSGTPPQFKGFDGFLGGNFVPYFDLDNCGDGEKGATEVCDASAPGDQNAVCTGLLGGAPSVCLKCTCYPAFNTKVKLPMGVIPAGEITTFSGDKVTLPREMTVVVVKKPDTFEVDMCRPADNTWDQTPPYVEQCDPSVIAGDAAQLDVQCPVAMWGADRTCGNDCQCHRKDVPLCPDGNPMPECSATKPCPEIVGMTAVCANGCCQYTPTTNEPFCGDSIKNQPSEDCDMGPFGGNSPDCPVATPFCTPPAASTPGCKCVGTGGMCNPTNGHKDPGEACDPSDPTPLDTQCGYPYATCNANCECGRNPPETQEACKPDGTLNIGPDPANPVEECDLFGTLPVGSPAYMTKLADHCEQTMHYSAHPEWGTLDECEINCLCDFVQPGCTQVPGAECTSSAECGTGQYCDVNCNCQGQPGETPGETPGEAPLDVRCSAKCLDYPEDQKANYDKLNASGREITGLSDDFACPPEHRMQFICTKVSSDTKAQLSASLAGPPYMLIQQTGAKFLDTSTLTWMYNENLEQPVRISPLEALEQGSAQKIKALVLPDLSASAEGGTMLAVEPMATTSATISSSGNQLINNMIEVKIYPLTGEAAQKVMAAGGQTTGQALVFEWITTLPPLCGPYTAVEGAENVRSCQIPIEDKLYDTTQYLAVVKESLSATPNLADYTDFEAGTLKKTKDLPWQAEQKFQFSLAFEDDVRNVGVISGPPTMFGMGSGSCSCNVAAASPLAGDLILLIMTLLVPVGGIAVGRVRRRGRK